MYFRQIKRIFLFAFFLVCVDSSWGKQYASQPTYTAKPRVETDYRDNATDTSDIHGAYGGYIYEDDDYLIMDGVTLVNESSDKSLLKSNVNGKKIILNNVNVVSSNASTNLIDLASAKNNRIDIRNMRVISNNSNIYGNKCGANICLGGDNINKINNISVKVGGINNFTSGK